MYFKDRIIQVLLEHEMICDCNGCLQPANILEVGSYEFNCKPEDFNSLPKFELAELKNSPLNGCLPAMHRTDFPGKYEICWIYGYVVKMGKMNVLTSSGSISEEFFARKDFRLACNIEDFIEQKQKSKK